MSSRAYPKCFKSKLTSIRMYDFLKHQKVLENRVVTNFLKIITNLLCGIHLYNQKNDTELLKQRYSRFLLVHYYHDVEWESILVMYKNLLTKTKSDMMEFFNTEPESRQFIVLYNELIKDIYDDISDKLKIDL